MKPWVKVLLGLGAALAVAWLVAWAFLAATVGGVLDHVLHREPDPLAADVAAARATALPGTEAVAAEVEESAVATLTGAATPGRGTQDGCAVGQHTWKRDDPFDLVCGHERTALVTLDPASFRADALALHRALLARGWTAEDSSVAAGPRGGLPWVVAEYWDPRTSAGGDQSAAQVGALPTCRYRRTPEVEGPDGEGPEVEGPDGERPEAQVLTIGWVDPSADPVIGLPSHPTDVVVSADPVDPGVLRDAAPGAAVAVLRVEVTYWDR